MHQFTFKPQGPFDLLNQNRYSYHWPSPLNDPKTIVMTFPVEGHWDTATISLTQATTGQLIGHVYGDKHIRDRAISQALAALSLDEDGRSWPQTGRRDKIIYQLQQQYHYLRPGLFASVYEAAAACVIGQRLGADQTRQLRQRLAQHYGQVTEVMGQPFFAFPSPLKLLQITNFPGLNAFKVKRLQVVAQAAVEGWLERPYLRAQAEEAALAELESLPGIGTLFAQAILRQGVGFKDSFTMDDATFQAIKTAYDLPSAASLDEVLQIAENWRPHRNWALNLLYIWAAHQTSRDGSFMPLVSSAN